MEEFVACFADVIDPRQDNARHDLHELLLIALCTILTGGKDCSDMALFGEVKEPFLRQFLRLRHGIPSHDTFSRVFRLLDPVPFEACFTRFMQRFAEGLQGVVAIDGKTLRRSFDRAAGKSPLHMLHAWSVDQRLLLGQLAVDGKSNKITAVPKLLELLSLKGSIVTADALNCQRAIAAKVVAQGGDYVLALKGNQGRLLDDVRTSSMTPRARRRPSIPPSMATMAASRLEPASFQATFRGYRSNMPGRVLRPSARSSAPAKRAPRSAPTPPIIYSAPCCPRFASAMSPAPIGVWRTACIGFST